MLKKVPTVTFKNIKREATEDDTPNVQWFEMTTKQLFGEKKSVLFSLPGAFTPICSTFQLPLFDSLYSDFTDLGINEVYCLSVNDPFVMDAWKTASSIEHVQLIPDGTGEFTRKMGMLVHKDNLAFGMRSWRYAAIIDDENIVAWFEEPGFADNCPDDPYGETTPQSLLDFLRK